MSSARKAEDITKENKKTCSFLCEYVFFDNITEILHQYMINSSQKNS